MYADVSRRRWLALLTAVVFAVGLLPVFLRAAEARPNIVFLFADDLGYGDLGCYGHPYARTPNIDRLAQEGTRHLQFYVTGVTCCPSRTGFMTGRFPARFPVYPANGGFADHVTVTQRLQEAGYATGHFGKWHIGPVSTPGTYGIDVVEVAGGNRRGAQGRDTHIYDAAIRFIEEHRDRPFYVNVWGHISHHPVNPLDAFADRFRNVEFQESLFPTPMQAKFETVRQRGGDVADCLRKYLGDVSSLDDDVGRLLARLDELGLTQRTIVVFSSDHGAPAIPSVEQELKRSAADGDGATVSLASVRLNLMGSNGHLRGGKHNSYEGGVRSPFIVRWPGRVPAGRVDADSVTSGIDWLPSLCALAGVDAGAADLDGEDVSGCWFGESTHVRTRPLLWKTSNPRADVTLRDGAWKLRLPGTKRSELELFDLSRDPGEQHNLAGERDDVVQRLRRIAEDWNRTLPAAYEKTEDRED